MQHTWFSFFIELVRANVCICENTNQKREEEVRVLFKYKMKHWSVGNITKNM